MRLREALRDLSRIRSEVLYREICLFLPGLGLEKVAHVLRVREKIGVGSKGVRVNILQAGAYLTQLGAGVRPLTGLFEETVGKVQGKSTLNFIV